MRALSRPEEAGEVMLKAARIASVGFALVGVLRAVGCSKNLPTNVPESKPAPPVAAVTTLSPPPGVFNDKLTVTLTTDKPATIIVSTDGSDPATSGSRVTGASPLSVQLKKTTKLQFFSQTPQGPTRNTREARHTPPRRAPRPPPARRVR